MELHKIHRRLLSRLARIENKCDIIATELVRLRQNHIKQAEFDSVLDRLHLAARRMKRQCNVERNIIRRMSKPVER